MTVTGVVEAHLSAFNAGDVDLVVALFADDAVFTSGDQLVIGRRALTALFTAAFGGPVTARLELRRAIVQDDTAACELVERLAIGGGVTEFPVAAFYTVRGGQLVHVRVYRDAPA